MKRTYSYAATTRDAAERRRWTFCEAVNMFALVFKLDVPTEILLADERNDVARIIHETAANIEQFAIDDGHANSKGLAAGSCKRIFCSGYDECRVLNEDSDCRFPNLARPSLSGLGVNFFKLSKVLGWQISKITKNSNPDDVPIGMMAGIVLIGAGDLRQ